MNERTDAVTYEKRDNIAFVTLNQPEKNNALTNEVIKKLRGIWVEYESDPEMRVAILTGRGKTFCTGMDLEEVEQGLLPDLDSCMPNLGIEITKPIIGAINGWAIGAGMGLASCCDIRIMSDQAKFSFPEAKIGFAGGGQEFAVDMPYAIAMEVWLTGEPMDAKRAYEVGFVNKIVPPAELMKEAMRYANIIKDNAPLTMKMLKMTALMNMKNAKRSWLKIHSTYIRPQLESEDLKEGIKALKEKRKPAFKGK